VTAQTKLSNAILQRSYAGVWPFDVESDGDLDLVLASKSGPAVVLQNNSDGSFSELKPFGSLQRVVDFAWFDIDEDGDGDAVSLDDGGTLSFYRNERGGLFEIRVGEAISDVTAIAVNDIFNSGRLMLIAAKRDGSVFAIGDVEGGITPVRPLVFSISLSGTRLLTGDLDNNGATDVVSTRTTSLSDGSGSFGGVVFDGDAFNIVDINSDGKLDLVGLDSTGRPATFTNSGTKNYHWQILRPRAQKVEGDQRVNSFGIGGEIEMRAGLQPQKRVVASPQVHFGLGEQTSADVIRVIWGNGFVQAEFELGADQKIEAVQRLKGSCPHLFAWNGEKFAHVKDAPPWSPALGLKINAQDTYGILQTEEWFKIPGRALKPKDGFYELRITGEYWESFYLDNYKLLAVDHPEETEVFTDERFSIPLPPLKVFTTGNTKPFANATDHNGRDVLETVAELDEKYLDGIKRGRFQGVAQDHFVELELPADAPPDKRLWVVADGWMHPTDASINVQRGQQTDARPPRSLSIEVEGEGGNWRTFKENLGFPAGKMKTVLLDLSGAFAKDAKKRRFRIRTELEVFWDKLSWAVDLDDVDNRTKELDLAEASLRYRGFSVIEKRDDSSPEVPRYDQILTTNQRWRDLEGYYTRFGDVKELLLNTDDRIVLMNAGDELVLKFAALPEVEKGMKRDFVIIGNGWIKDGDLNSVFSKTLLPLPTQRSNDYSRRPTVLEDDPTYQRNKQDWVNFHTRYVSPTQFSDALRWK
ncbi:MAG: CRTAC1 family protein, partial [Pyrinomonadaceae bacterium]